MMEPCSALGLMIGTLLVVAPVKGDVTDTEVSCVFMESCILPCSFQGGTDVDIHWTQVTAGNRPVHSYYDNQDQLTHQDQRFRDRTSLFKDQISRGNASLLLTGVKVQDQGRYRCFTRTIRGDKYSFINLTVDDLRQTTTTTPNTLSIQTVQAAQHRPGSVHGSDMFQAVADTQVSCVYMESCILPCSFQGDTDVIIDWTEVTEDCPVHWTPETAGDCLVHSYNGNQDKLTNQDQRYRNRTSLFKDQISRGNASLLLTEVKVQDQIRYQCYTSTENERNESFINVTVDAPVRKVNLQQVENRITCSSEGIYPEPELTWSTRPPSSVTFKNNTEVQRTEQLLYNISSSLILSDSDSDLSYICNISTDRNSKRATLRQLSSISCSSSEATIPRTASYTSLTNFSLTWRFNHSQIILTQTRADDPPTVSEGWRQQVKGVSESGSLMLQHLSPSHEGTYTCELRDAEETLITNTFLRIEEGVQNNTIVILVVVLGVILAAVVIALVLYHKWIRKARSTI